MTKNLWIAVAKIVAVLLMIAAIVILSVSLKKQTDEKKRLKDNYDIEMRQDRAMQQKIDMGELKEYFHKEVETLKEYGIRPRDVDNIVEVTYYVHDTTIYRDTLIYVYDTVRNAQRADFCVQTGCYYIDGQIVGDTLEIYDILAQDELLISLYKEKRKCLFGKRKVKAIAISACTGDTMAIKRNLIIER